MAKTLDEQIATVQEELTKKENRYKQLLNQKKEQERKIRTRRLIERGAILESLIDKEVRLTNEQIKSFLETVLTDAAIAEVLKDMHESTAISDETPEKARSQSDNS